MDQASDNAPQAHVRDEPFELNVTEDPPTADQLRTMLEYAEQSGEGEIAKIVEGANNVTQALKAFEKSKESFSRPVVSFFLFCGLFHGVALLRRCNDWKRRWRSSRKTSKNRGRRRSEGLGDRILSLVRGRAVC